MLPVLKVKNFDQIMSWRPGRFFVNGVMEKIIFVE